MLLVQQHIQLEFFSEINIFDLMYLAQHMQIEDYIFSPLVKSLYFNYNVPKETNYFLAYWYVPNIQGGLHSFWIGGMELPIFLKFKLLPLNDFLSAL